MTPLKNTRPRLIALYLKIAKFNNLDLCRVKKKKQTNEKHHNLHIYKYIHLSSVLLEVISTRSGTSTCAPPGLSEVLPPGPSALSLKRHIIVLTVGTGRLLCNICQPQPRHTHHAKKKKDLKLPLAPTTHPPPDPPPHNPLPHPHQWVVS